MGCVTKDCFVWEAKVCHGIVIDLDQVNDMIEAGILPIDKDGYILSPEGGEVLKSWVKSGKPALDPDATVHVRPHSSDLVGTSTDAGDKLYRLTIEKMKKENISYAKAFDKVQRENPDLARKVAAQLDDYRHRNDKPR